MKKLLLVVPIAMLLAAGCNQQPNVQQNTHNSNPPAQQLQTAQTQQPETQTPIQQTNNYLIIKEWGIKFEKPAGMEDLKYLLKFNTASDGAVYFSTQKLLDLDKNFNAGKTSCDVDQAPIGALGRTKNLPGPNDRQIPTNTKIGAYYYWFDGSQAACSENKQVVELETKQTSSLSVSIRKSLKSAQ